jgi:hypothetical protein
MVQRINVAQRHSVASDLIGVQLPIGAHRCCRVTMSAALYHVAASMILAMEHLHIQGSLGG